MATKVTYDRPVEAELVVKLNDGHTFPARPADYTKFGLINRLGTYSLFDTTLTRILTDNGLINHDSPTETDGYRELTDTELNPLRYFIENVICFPELLNLPDHEGWANVANIETALRAVNKIRALHAPKECPCNSFTDTHLACTECGTHWPCNTIDTLGTVAETTDTDH